MSRPSRGCEHLARLQVPHWRGRTSQVVGPTKQQERSVTVAANGDVPQLAGRRRIADALMFGHWPKHRFAYSGEQLPGGLCVRVEVASVDGQQGVFLGCGQVRVGPDSCVHR